ncbi:unnamed protein product [Dovyalis caffra]|uniref:Methyltransferase type 11 domain-containing protein n=1 Tax=Dovyalis caffra TaxID=77055 RepID=A0AAV1SQW7_9ROSI|nr:unnamed protein product [Dovyalis caffra]
MAGLFDKQAAIYLDARPNYPNEWYAMLADLTPHHSLAWDAGTGNGQSALGVAEHYEQVIGTDISVEQLKHAVQHPRVQYLHTPLSISDDELVNLIGGENSVDLVTVAEAVHWFDLPKFYAVVKRVLKKPGGIIAVWGYNDMNVSPTFDAIKKSYREACKPYWNPNAKYALDGYRTLPFPFENVGLGCEGEPLLLDIPKEISLERYLGVLKSTSTYNTARELGVDLLSEKLVNELEDAWGGPRELVRSVTYKAFMLAGKIKLDSEELPKNL